MAWLGVGRTCGGVSEVRSDDGANGMGVWNADGPGFSGASAGASGRLGAGVDWGGVVVAGGRGVVDALTVGVVGIVGPSDGGAVARGVGADSGCVGDVAAVCACRLGRSRRGHGLGGRGRAGWGFVGGQQGAAIGADHRVCPGIDRPAASASPPWFPP